MKTLPTRKDMCSTCPFRPDGWSEVRGLLETRALSQGTPICHSTGRALKLDKGQRLKAHYCRGARNFQIAFFHRIGLLKEATDAAWAALLADVQRGKS